MKALYHLILYFLANLKSFENTSSYKSITWGKTLRKSPKKMRSSKSLLVLKSFVQPKKKDFIILTVSVTNLTFEFPANLNYN